MVNLKKKIVMQEFTHLLALYSVEIVESFRRSGFVKFPISNANRRCLLLFSFYDSILTRNKKKIYLKKKFQRDFKG